MTPDINAYTAVMEDIKRRQEVVVALHKRELDLRYPVIQIESIILQVRKILELIALASLAAHKSVFEQNQKKLQSHWELVKIIKDVEALNPNFYPKPILEKPSQTPGVINDLHELTSGFLTKDELIEIHGRCGNVLHARNPYGKKLDYSSYVDAIPSWLGKITRLLNCHQIHLLDDRSRFYLVHMKEDQDDRVHMYTFQLVNP
jgi:hypothetical protein